MKLLALKTLKYAGKRYNPGDAFHATTKHAKVLILIGRAMVDPADAMGVSPERLAQEAAAKAAEPVKVAPKRRGSSRPSRHKPIDDEEAPKVTVDDVLDQPVSPVEQSSSDDFSEDTRDDTAVDKVDVTRGFND